MKYETKLKKIKGVGDETVKDILAVYPTEKDLKRAILNGDHLPFENKIAELLKKEFQPTKTEKIKIEAESVKIVCNTPGIIIMRGTNPTIRVRFDDDKPKLVSKEVAEYLLNDGTDRFRIHKEE